ncbi:MAG TPA: MmgE/PrpD family protein [Usitatibacter sp.]|nr:MmgE/PrpD family protein [Usitatibacter sp.]
MPFAAEILAKFVSTLELADLPETAVDSARRHLLDTFGVAIRGRSHGNAQNAVAALAEGRVPGGAPVWGTSETYSTGHAALANGVASHVLDFDDTHTDSIVHGSAIIVPVVMALGHEVGAKGGDVVTAFVAGWEVAARVGLAAKGTFHKRGFHTTSIAGVFGAAAAAAKLLGLSSQQTAHAIGIAGSQASGINEYLSNSSSAKCIHTGWSAHAGILAARLAKGGMTGPMSVFEGRDGILRAYGHPEGCDVAQLTADLGTRWESTRVSIKPYPCCHFAHAFVDCAGALAARGIKPADIAALHCVVPEIELPLICEPWNEKLKPASSYAAKFSLPFMLASRLVDGRLDHRTFEAANLGRAELLDLAARVTYRVAQPGETPFPRTFPGWVEATLADGRKVIERLDVNAGHPDNPLSLEQVAAKFRDNAAATLGEAACANAIALTRALPATPAADLGRALAATPSYATA